MFIVQTMPHWLTQVNIKWKLSTVTHIHLQPSSFLHYWTFYELSNHVAVRIYYICSYVFGFWVQDSLQTYLASCAVIQLSIYNFDLHCIMIYPSDQLYILKSSLVIAQAPPSLVTAVQYHQPSYDCSPKLTEHAWMC